jgi:hypothetical protein
MKDYIKKHYGSNVRMAKSLGVTNQTVTNWIKNNPRGMLKYLPEIVEECNTSYHQLVFEVMYHEKTLEG